MESDDFTRHYIIRYLSACELVLPPWVGDVMTTSAEGLQICNKIFRSTHSMQTAWFKAILPDL